MNTYYTVGKYKISHVCYQTYPCKHNVEHIGLISGDKIHCMLKEEGLSHPHFDYAEFIRKRDYPTDEEIAEKTQAETRIRESQKKYEQEQEERARITNMYKASSRLDRLKAKHNIT